MSRAMESELVPSRAALQLGGNSVTGWWRACCRADTLFNLKFTSKQLQRQSKKCEKAEKSAKKKVEKVWRTGVVCTQQVNRA